MAHVTFKRVSAYGMVSTCQRWRIGKIVCNGVLIYELWDAYKLAGRFELAQQAKDAAQ